MGDPCSHPLDTPLGFGLFCFLLGTLLPPNSGFRCIWSTVTRFGAPWMPQEGEGGITHWISRNARFSTSFTLYLRLNLEKKERALVSGACPPNAGGPPTPTPGSLQGPPSRQWPSLGSLPGFDHVSPLEALEPVTEDVALGLRETEEVSLGTGRIQGL